MRPTPLDGWEINDHVTQPPLRGWWVARARHNFALPCPPGTIRWIWSVRPESDAVASHLAATLQRSVAVNHPNLAPLLGPEAFRLVNGSAASEESARHQLLVGMPELAGRSLYQLAAKPLSSGSAMQLIARLASALGRLHRAGLVHGQLAMSRLWLTDQKQLLLLRDPVGMPIGAPPPAAAAAALENLSSHSGPALPELADYWAPELSLPGAAPSPLADWYALGIVGYRLLTGRTPWSEATSLEAKRLAHAERPLAWPATDHVSEAARTLVTYLAAKNRASRLSSADQVLKFMAHTDLISVELAEKLANLVADGSEPAVAAAVARPPDSVGRPQPVQAPAEAPTRLSQLLDQPPPGAAARRSPGRRPAGQARKGHPGRQPLWWLAVAVAGTAALVVSLWWLWRPAADGGRTAVTRSGSVEDRAEVTPVVDVGSRGTAHQSVADRYQLLADDGQLVWGPPAGSSAPLSLELLAPGPDLIVSLDVPSWLESHTGTEIVQLLDPLLGSALQWLSAYVGQPLEQLKQVVLVAYHSPESGDIEWLVRCQLKQPIAWSRLQAAWGEPTIDGSASEGDLTYLAGPQQAFLVPLAGRDESGSDDQTATLFVTGPPRLVREAAQLAGQPPPLVRQLELLRNSTDTGAAIIILARSNFLRDPMAKQLGAPLPGIVAIMEGMIEPDSRGVMLVSHLEPQWFMEMRAIGDGPQQAMQTLQSWKALYASAAEGYEQELIERPADTYWRAIANRFPLMLRQLHRQQRFGIEDGQAICNWYLPSTAAVNMWFASYMRIRVDWSARPIDVGFVPESPPTTPEHAAADAEPSDRWLAQKVSLVFGQEAFEPALGQLFEAVADNAQTGNPPISWRIDGEALERDGITRNQELRDMRLRDQPLRMALNELVRRGNPTPGLEPLSQPEQRLVWLVEQTAQGGWQVVITTRRAAEAGRLSLPAEFLP
jgi:hypothetical protein